jgi:hypothetical protein
MSDPATISAGASHNHLSFHAHYSEHNLPLVREKNERFNLTTSAASAQTTYLFAITGFEHAFVPDEPLDDTQRSAVTCTVHAASAS